MISNPGSIASNPYSNLNTEDVYDGAQRRFHKSKGSSLTQKMETLPDRVKHSRTDLGHTPSENDYEYQALIS